MAAETKDNGFVLVCGLRGSGNTTRRCVCRAEVAADRFARRARHPGHLEGQRTNADVLASIRALPDMPPPNLGEVIHIDTSDFVTAAAVAREVTDAFARCLTSACSRRRPVEP